MIISQITQRLQEVNNLLAGCEQNSVTFEQALVLSLFYRDFNDTNRIVTETTAMFQDDAEKLAHMSSSLLSETERFLSMDTAGLETVDFENLFESHTGQFETRYNESKAISTALWREYSSMGNRLDFLPVDSDDYKTLDRECDMKKHEYDIAHTHTARLYDEWQRERERTFCVYCFKPVFLTVLVERLRGIAESIINDTRRMKEGGA